MITGNGGNGGLSIKTTVDLEIDNSGIIAGGGGGSAGAISIKVDDLGARVQTSFAIIGGSSGAGSIGMPGGTAIFSNKLINPNAKNNIYGAASSGSSTNNVTTPGGSVSITGSYPNTAGTTVTAIAGQGGSLGQAGSASSTSPFPLPNSDYNRALGSPGSPGTAIDGVSLCTITGTGSILGPTIN
jgi:hypothetical protein